MRTISKRKIEKSLQRSMSTISSKKIENKVSFNYKEERKMKKNLFIPVLIPAFMVLLAVLASGTMYYNKSLKTYSSVIMDVNPSITLSTNSYDKVIKVSALNEDGEKILESIDVNGLEIEEASDIIIDQLIKEGYLEGDGANILLTVLNNDLDVAKEMESLLLESVNAKLDEKYIAGTVLTQVDTLKKNITEDVKSMMDTYEISYSKAVFLSNILKKDETIEVSKIATLKINEISRLVHNKNIDINDIVGHDDKDSMYESALLVKAKKQVEEKIAEEKKAEEKLEKAYKELLEKQKSGLDTEKAQNAYEEAKEYKEQIEGSLAEARNSYTEVEKEYNQGSTTQNTKTNQNTNGQTQTNDNTTNNQQSSNSTSNGTTNKKIN